MKISFNLLHLEAYVIAESLCNNMQQESTNEFSGC